jgi:hypothetical protein
MFVSTGSAEKRIRWPDRRGFKTDSEAHISDSFFHFPGGVCTLLHGLCGTQCPVSAKCNGAGFVLFARFHFASVIATKTRYSLEGKHRNTFIYSQKAGDEPALHRRRMPFRHDA